MNENRVREMIGRFDRVSKWPFRPGHPCDGTRDPCAWGCLFDAVRQSNAGMEQLASDVNAAYDRKVLTSEGVRIAKRKAFWEGLLMPKAWTEEWVGRLIESLRSMNWSTLAGMLRRAHLGGAQGRPVWGEELAKLDEEPVSRSLGKHGSGTSIRTGATRISR